jgi:hypothetical protein
MLRKVQGREEATSCLKAAEASGLPRADWARQQGIDPRSLNAWRVNLERRSSTPRMVELVPRAVVTTRYTIRFGDFAVDVDDRFDERALRRLLGVVTTC